MSDSLANLIVSLVGNPTALLAAFEQVTAAGEAMAESVSASVAAVEAALARVGAGAEEAAAAVSAAATEQETAVVRASEAQTEAMAAVATAQTEAATAAEVSSTKIIDLDGMIAASAEASAEKVTAATTEEASAYERLAASAAAAEKTILDTNVTSASGMQAVFSKSGLAMTGLAAVVGYESVKMAGDFQASTARLVASGGELNANLETDRKGILDLAGQVGYSADELSAAMYKVTSATTGISNGGSQGAKGLLILKAAAQGAKTENADLVEVADAVTTSLIDYHLRAEDAASVTSKLVAATSAGKMNFQELSSSLSSLAPVASAAHISLDDMLGTLASMTQHGISAQQATQNIADAIRHLQNPTGVMRSEMAALGINADDVALKLGQRGLAGTMEYLQQAVAKAMPPGTDKVILDLQNAVKNSTPAVQQLAQKLMDGSISMKDFTAAAKDMDPISYKQAAAFATLAGQTHQLGSTQMTGAQALQSYGGAMAKVMGDATGLKVSLMTTGENAQNTNDAISAVSGATVDASGNVKGWADVQDNFNTKLAQFKDGIGALAIKIGKVLLPVLTPVVGALGDVFNWISQNQAVAVTLAFVIGGVLTVALGALTVKAIAAVTGPSVALLKGIGSVISWATQFILRVTGVTDAVKLSASERELADKNAAAAADAAADEEASAAERAAGAMESAAASMEAAATKLSETLQLPATAAEEAAARIEAANERDIASEDEKAASLAELVARTRAAMEEEAATAEQTAEAVVAASKKTETAALDMGEAITAGTTEGIETGEAATVEATTSFAEKIIETFKKLFRIASPAGVTIDMGLNLDQGLAQGVEEGTPLVVDAVDVLAQEVVAAAEKIAAEAAAAGEQLDVKLAAGIEESAEVAIAAGRTVAAEVVAAVDAETALVKPVVVRTVAEPGAGGAAAAEGEGAAAAGAGAAAAGKGVASKLGGTLLRGAGTVFGVGLVAQVADSVLPQNTDAQNQAGMNPFGGAANYTDHSRSELAGLAGAMSNPGQALDDMKKQFAAFPAEFQSSPFMTWLKGLPKTIQQSFSDIGKGLKVQVDMFTKPFRDAWSNLSSWWNGTAMPWIKSLPSKLGAGIVLSVDLFTKPFKDAWTNLTTWWSGTAAPWLAGMGPRIVAFFNNAPVWLAQKGSDIIHGLYNGFIAWWNSTVAPWYTGIGPKIVAFFNNAPIWLAQKGADVIHGLYNGFLNWWNGTVVPWWNQLTAAIKGFIKDPLGILESIGESIINGFLNGLKSAWNSVVSFVSGIGPWIAAHKGPIEADRVLLQPHGQAIMSGLVAGLSDGMPGLDRQLEAITGRVQAVGGDGAALTIGGAGGGGFGIGGTGGVTVHVHVAGTVLAERDLATTVQQALLRHGIRNPGSGTTYGFASGR